MVLNDTLANALSIVAQYDTLGKTNCIVQPSSKTITTVFGILKKFGYIKSYNKVKEGNKEHVSVKLNGKINRCGVIKPRYAIQTEDYEKFEKRYLPSRNMGVMIVSTVSGMVDHNKAKSKKQGGRLIAYCY